MDEKQVPVVVGEDPTGKPPVKPVVEAVKEKPTLPNIGLPTGMQGNKGLQRINAVGPDKRAEKMRQEFLANYKRLHTGIKMPGMEKPADKVTVKKP